MSKVYMPWADEGDDGSNASGDNGSSDDDDDVVGISYADAPQPDSDTTPRLTYSRAAIQERNISIRSAAVA